MTNYEENQLIEQIATLLDKYLGTEIEDLTNIQKMVDVEKKESKIQQLVQNNLDEVNGGSK
jgi:plasmid maintenance system antidote protein VapI